MSLEIYKRTERVTETPSPQDKVILISDAYILNEYLNNYRKYAKKKTKKQKKQRTDKGNASSNLEIYIFFICIPKCF